MPSLRRRFGIEFLFQRLGTQLVLTQCIRAPAAARHQQHEVAVGSFIDLVQIQQAVQLIDGLDISTLFNEQVGEAAGDVAGPCAQSSPCQLQPILVVRLACCIPLQQITAVQLECLLE
ncbi:MAG: hypothetical protein P8Z31_07325, partial [Gammaproteobacteria bacterium]